MTSAIVNLDKSPLYIMVAKEGEHLLVNGVECMLREVTMLADNSKCMYLTTVNSRVHEYQSDAAFRGEDYSDYIHHVRTLPQGMATKGAAVLTRLQMLNVLQHKEFVIG